MELDIAKQQYFKEHLEKGLRDIFDAQRMIATQRIYSVGKSRTQRRESGRTVEGRSGILLDALTNPRYSVSFSGKGVYAQSNVPTYIRFLDMKKHGNFKIYNRQIWGILYSETLGNIKYEFREWLKKNFPELMNQFNNKKR
ncbi:MAG: hypothetical protein K2L89_00575 [Muribaculaceae bacterium]|nr:hypothetical protein [Muribaculaceae bacterium]